jgi:hypothetical protein
MQSAGRGASWAVWCLVALFVAVAVPGAAQEFRGGVSGVITDASGGVLPGVTVVVTNTGTNVSSEATTSAEGRFEVRFLNPGTYSVTAKLSGFKTVVRSGLEVRVGDTLKIDMVMAVGALEETVEVVGTTPVLNTTTGITGQVVDSRQIRELPLGDGTAYMLTRLSPGVSDSSDLHFSRPGDNGNLAGFKVNGVQGNNEFSIDGAPNMNNAGGVGFSPPSDAIAEFKMQTNSFDAQAGHTAGGVVNLALKSGTNNLNGSLGYFNRNDSRTATPLLTQRAGGTKPTRTYNRYLGTVSGPVVKNKTFFMGSFEHLRDVQPEPAYYTVPTAKMRTGDLSEFSNLIYDPATATGSSNTRKPFTGNVIPNERIDAVARAYASYYPMPNLPGTISNYFTNQLRPYDYNAALGRVDQNFNESARAYATVYWNKRREDRYNWAKGASNATGEGIINDFLVTQGYDYRTNLGIGGGYTHVLSSTFVLDVRGSWAQYGEWRDPAQSFDPATLGFSSTATQLMNGYQYMPLFTFGSFSTTNSNSTIASLGAQRSDWSEGFNRPIQTYGINPTLTKVWGGHSLRFGYDGRYQRWQVTNAGYPGGRYQFNGAYTRASNSASQNDRAQSWAQFLLGLPTATTGTVANAGSSSSQFEIAAEGDFRQWTHGVFVQDDWRATSKLTLNLGFRLELGGGMSEAQNRNLAGFDTAVASPIQAAAQAAYAANPIPEIPASQFKVPGGLLFASGPTWNTLVKPLPRAGFSYAINQKTVLRGGVGLFSYDYFFDTINQQGFSQATPILVTTNNGTTYTGATLTNPIPSGQLVQPTGSSLGLSTGLGLALTGNSPAGGGQQSTPGNMVQMDRSTPYYTRWQISVQRDLGGGWVTELSYVGSRGKNLPVFQDVNNIPMQYLSTSRSRDATNESYLSTQVANPFAGLLPGSTINGSTVARQQLLRPYPEFLTFGIEQYTGSDSYNAGTIQVEKRFGAGSSLTVQYTRSSLRDKRKYLNPQDNTLEDRVSPDDRPNRLSVGGVLRLPFGHGAKWGSGWNGAVDAFLGGWQVSGTYGFQSGFPLTWGSVYWDSACGDPSSLVSNIGQKIDGKIAGLDMPAWNTSCFYFHDALVQTNGVDNPAKQQADQRIQLGNNVRYFPSTLSNVRTATLHLLDLGISKNFELPRKMRLQLRIEAINALNYTVLWNPDLNPRNSTFGYVNQERNNPRDVQIGLKFTF